MGGGGWDSPSHRADRAEGPRPLPGPACLPSCPSSSSCPLFIKKKKKERKLFLLKNYLFIFGCTGSCCCGGLSLVAASRGHSLVAVRGPPTAVASLVEEHGLEGAQALAAARTGGSCPAACGIFPDQGSNPCPHLIGRWILNHPGSPLSPF